MILLSLGSNINSKENMQRALSLLSTKFTITTQSSLYNTEPFGYDNQEWFLNQVIEIETVLAPHLLLKKLQEIEQELSRERTIPNGPRTIDIDILLYNNQIIDESDLQIPHPKLQNRNFILIPLTEIASLSIHPLLNKPITQLLHECNDTKQVHKLL